MRSAVSVIIPTYNEEENIEPLIVAIKKNITSEDEIIVVDDDSSDGTPEIVRRMSMQDASVRLICRKNERGLTSAISTGIKAAKNDIVLWMDADMSMPPKVIPEMLHQVEHVSIVVGSRYTDGGKDDRGIWLHTFLSFGLNKICRYLLYPDIYDWTSGFICARKNIFDTLTLKGDYGEYCIDLLYNATKRSYSVTEIGYRCINRQKGTSKTATSLFGFLLKGRKYIATIIRLKLQ